MEFIETTIFTRQVTELLSEPEYRALQVALLADPERGALIPGGGGIRKLRFGAGGRGKSGGIRVIYFWAKGRERVYLLLIYPKNQKDNLSQAETAALRAYVKEL